MKNPFTLRYKKRLVIDKELLEGCQKIYGKCEELHYSDNPLLQKMSDSLRPTQIEELDILIENQKDGVEADISHDYIQCGVMLFTTVLFIVLAAVGGSQWANIGMGYYLFPFYLLYISRLSQTHHKRMIGEYKALKEKYLKLEEQPHPAIDGAVWEQMMMQAAMKTAAELNGDEDEGPAPPDTDPNTWN